MHDFTNSTSAADDAAGGADSAEAAENFWDLGGFKSCVKRARDAAVEFDDFTKMIRERADLEAKYARALAAWHAKWTQQVGQFNGPSIRQTCKLIVEEAAELSRTHAQIGSRLEDEVLKTLANFRKSTFHYSRLRGLREANDLDEEFEKAQRQWAKLHDRCAETRKSFHSACRAEKSAYINLMNSRAAEEEKSGGKQAKVREAHEKCQQEVIRTRANYENCVQEINSYVSVYNESMSFVFEKSQQAELKRAKFTMEMLRGFSDILAELLSPQKLTILHAQIREILGEIKDARLAEDLRLWSTKFGALQELRAPRFVEYAPEMRAISTQKTKKSEAAENSVVLTRQIQHSHLLPDAPKFTTIPQHQPKHQHQHRDPQLLLHQRDQTLTSSLQRDAAEREKRASTAMSVASSQLSCETQPPQQTQRLGRVLYDYRPVEDDEMSLKSGEILQVISGPDDLGWCFGRKPPQIEAFGLKASEIDGFGREGLFPSKFVELI